MMSGITNWSEALAHPCFWAEHYALNPWGATRDVEAFFGRSAEQCEAFFRLLYGDEDFHTPLPPGAGYESIPANVLGLSFPENFTWMLEFGGDGLAHRIDHPQIYPGGLPIAEVSGHFLLPGLRWAELTQMVACSFQPEWSEVFDLQTLYPLLYTMVDPVTFAEYDEVRQTLRTAWEALQIVRPSQLEQWLDVSIRVYEKGRLLSYNAVQGWYDPVERHAQDPKIVQVPRTFNEEELWLPDPTGGWYTNWPWSLRHDTRTFAPFFEMLDCHTQPHR